MQRHLIERASYCEGVGVGTFQNPNVDNNMKTLWKYCILFLGLTITASAQVSAYNNVKLFEQHVSGGKEKTNLVSGTLNFDPNHKNVIFVVKENVRRTVPYQSIFEIDYYMSKHILRIQYKNSTAQPDYVDFDLPDDHRAELIKQLQAQTGIAVRLT